MRARRTANARGAVGYLVGEENRGLEYMFIMMNAARLSVGLEGYALAERAYQQALEYARNRMQGRPGRQAPTADRQAGADCVSRRRQAHAADDEGVRRMRHARSRMYAALQLDLARASIRTRRVRAAAQARGDLLIPIVKGWSTELGVATDVAGHPGARRHGLHRGNRRRSVLARRAHRDDLRRYDREFRRTILSAAKSAATAALR